MFMSLSLVLELARPLPFLLLVGQPDLLFLEDFTLRKLPSNSFLRLYIYIILSCQLDNERFLFKSFHCNSQQVIDSSQLK